MRGEEGSFVIQEHKVANLALCIGKSMDTSHSTHSKASCCLPDWPLKVHLYGFSPE